MINSWPCWLSGRNHMSRHWAVLRFSVVSSWPGRSHVLVPVARNSWSSRIALKQPAPTAKGRLSARQPAGWVIAQVYVLNAFGHLECELLRVLSLSSQSSSKELASRCDFHSVHRQLASAVNHAKRSIFATRNRDFAQQLGTVVTGFTVAMVGHPLQV